MKNTRTAILLVLVVVLVLVLEIPCKIEEEDEEEDEPKRGVFHTGSSRRFRAAQTRSRRGTPEALEFSDGEAV